MVSLLILVLISLGLGQAGDEHIELVQVTIMRSTMAATPLTPSDSNRVALFIDGILRILLSHVGRLTSLIRFFHGQAVFDGLMLKIVLPFVLQVRLHLLGSAKAMHLLLEHTQSFSIVHAILLIMFIESKAVFTQVQLETDGGQH